MIWQFIINGIITGILYSLCAIGFALVYNTTRIFHIAAATIYIIVTIVYFHTFLSSARFGLDLRTMKHNCILTVIDKLIAKILLVTTVNPSSDLRKYCTTYENDYFAQTILLDR